MTSSRISIPATPKGWYTLCPSAELAAGQVHSATYFEQRLALFRGADGQAHLLDAWCPHQGANLGRGLVHGETLACPYHGWRFAGNGQCAHIPGTDKITSAMKVRSWPLLERNGLLMAWYEPDGGAPEWEIPDLGVFGQAPWTEPVMRDFTVRSHVIEIGENQVDFAHWPYVHKTAGFPQDVEVTDEQHILRVHARVGMGPVGAESMTDVHITSWGLGFGQLHFKGLVEAKALVATTPTDNDQTLVRFYIFLRQPEGQELDPMVRTLFTEYFFQQVSQDMEILDDKIFREKPMLSAADGPIAIYRKWTRQFLP